MSITKLFQKTSQKRKTIPDSPFALPSHPSTSKLYWLFFEKSILKCLLCSFSTVTSV
jgi:hypothetical protein